MQDGYPITRDLIVEHCCAQLGIDQRSFYQLERNYLSRAARGLAVALMREFRHNCSFGKIAEGFGWTSKSNATMAMTWHRMSYQSAPFYKRLYDRISGEFKVLVNRWYVDQWELQSA